MTYEEQMVPNYPTTQLPNYLPTCNLIKFPECESKPPYKSDAATARAAPHRHNVGLWRSAMHVWGLYPLLSLPSFTASPIFSAMQTVAAYSKYRHHLKRHMPKTRDRQLAREHR
ncbi:hypothetical protein ACRALDRAFT_206994 [Sodiomyces alcalophilus JCM 7366]|uniref:uncharacterized protein n=1 Tax=Sodiomyces alcalophilus JCM 7366 TaxID=591952 RepID=UPI0039B6D058